MGESGKLGSLRFGYCCPNQDSRDWGMGRMRGNLIAVVLAPRRKVEEEKRLCLTFLCR